VILVLAELEKGHRRYAVPGTPTSASALATSTSLAARECSKLRRGFTSTRSGYFIIKTSDALMISASASGPAADDRADGEVGCPARQAGRQANVINAYCGSAKEAAHQGSHCSCALLGSPRGTKTMKNVGRDFVVPWVKDCPKCPLPAAPRFSGICGLLRGISPGMCIPEW